MEDFEYSVEICDRDWECFFAECEECNLLPPSLAGLDDSGMSDIDDARSILAKRVQKVDLKASLSETDHLIDGPPDCEGSPVEHYLSKHGVGGMESVLSGSEEDLHLQSVNIFFERLKSGTEADRLTEPSQVISGKNRGKKKEEEKCGDGQEASGSGMPKNCPKLNSLSASGETAVGTVTVKPVDTISSIMKTIKRENSASNISPEPAASKSMIKTNKSAHHELFIREEAGAATPRKKEETQWNQSHASHDRVVFSGSTTQPDKVVKVDMYTTQGDNKQEHLLPEQVTLSKKSSTDSWSNLGTLTNVKWKEDHNSNILQLDATSTNKKVCLESSPSASLKRKRRKKRRLSVEAENVYGFERQVSVKQSDSEEEQRAWKGGTGLFASNNFHFPYLNQAQKTVMPSLTLYPATVNLPVKISSKDMNVNDLSHYSSPCASQYPYLKESIVRHTSSTENNTPLERSISPLSQTNSSVMSAQINSGYAVSNLKPHCKLQEESGGLNNHPGLQVSITDRVTSTSPYAGSPWQSDEFKHSVIFCKNEHRHRSCTAEVSSLTNSTESNDPAVDVSQNDKVSAAKSVLAVEAGNSGRNKHTPCQREAEAQQQLEIDCHYSDQYSPTLGKTQFPLCQIGTSGSDILNTQPKPIKTGACPSVEEMSCPVDSAEAILDTSSSLPDKWCQSKTPPSLDRNTAVRQTDPLLVLSAENTTAKRDELAASQIIAFHGKKPVLPGETCPSDVTPVSSCCTLKTESVKSVSKENITDMSGSYLLSVSQNNSGSQREKTPLLLTKHGEGDGSSTLKSQPVSDDTTELKCDLVIKEEEDAVTVSEAECELEKATDTKHSVFAMSSFWNEMEKLTINDILGLRRISKTPPSSSLSPLQETEETDMLTDSGFFTQPDESKTEQSSKDFHNDVNNTELSSDSGMAAKSPSSKTFMWETEPLSLCPEADVYPKGMIMTSVGDITEPVLTGNAQTCLRKISKNVSVHNLPALESKSNYTWKSQTLQTPDRGELEKVECFTNGHLPRQDKDCVAPSSTDSYRISLTDVFQYLFGGKQSIPSPSASDVLTSHYTYGNSVSETYDHFFSEFDTESFFYPLIATEDKAKDKLVPIFSCSRSANKNLQYPDSYEHFFASSSSDDSSEDEDNCGPVRVVSRLSRTSSASKICTDMYENFFTDKDLRQNFFWKNTLSLRNIGFAGSTVKKQAPSNPLSPAPLRQSGKSLQRTVYPVNVLGNQDVMFSDPLLCHLEERISRQLMQQPSGFEDLQIAVLNPRLDSSLLPLRHSDMCLLCIAFASWVMKTTNPQVGDAWKAVLLANVSALSAIRYLRKYVKMEAASGEKKLHCTTPSSS